MTFTSRYDPNPYGPETEPEEAAKYSEQHKAILAVFMQGGRYSSEEMRVAANLPIGTRVDSRIRDLRKPQFGAWPIPPSTKDSDGVYRYELKRRAQ
jgi:hypothetical protein